MSERENLKNTEPSNSSVDGRRDQPIGTIPSDGYPNLKLKSALLSAASVDISGKHLPLATAAGTGSQALWQTAIKASSDYSAGFIQESKEHPWRLAKCAAIGGGIALGTAIALLRS